MIRLAGYDVVATAACDIGQAQTLCNNSTHYLVVTVPLRDGVAAATGTLVETFPYGTGGFLPAYGLALRKMVEVALAHTEDDYPEPDVDACPGCGCVPGDGTTVGCTDPDGCGYWQALHGGVK